VAARASDGTETDGDLLIGADGLRSRVRTSIAAARATFARRELRILARVLTGALLALIALRSRSLFGHSETSDILTPRGCAPQYA
jgi:2-polyprenyl-6-methoxyphenol hydroxylase-like FAD-dependent oxidoreductase